MRRCETTVRWSFDVRGATVVEVRTMTEPTDESTPEIDPVTLEVIRNQFESVADEIGAVLIHGAYSPNITERRDCSAAIFDAKGRLLAQAEHIPVHLGALPAAVDAMLDCDPAPGEVYVCNDPYAGGSHLPDITMLAPIAPDGESIGYAATRAHHADVGGMTPGSMPAGATDIQQEGLRLPPTKIAEDGHFDDRVLDLVLANVRTPAERRADLHAQLAATERGQTRLADLLDEHGRSKLLAAMDAVLDYSRDRTEAAIAAVPDGTYRAEDVIEGDGVTEEDHRIAATVTVDDFRIDVDFAGTAVQVPGNMNAPPAVAKSATYFVVRAVTDPEIPPNQGCYDPISVSLPEGSLLNPTPPAAVVGGNVETSQRVTDVLLAAFAEAVPEQVPAASQGTMNNLVVGSSARRGADSIPTQSEDSTEATGDTAFTYYETIGGGFGARPDRDGIDGIQVGMTNTANTPIEALEQEYPIRVERYGLRPDSGGAGEFRGGTGIERVLTVLVPATVSLLTERRTTAPQGREGGREGATGENLIDGERVDAKLTRAVPAGTTITVRTPGGGGFGDPANREAAALRLDRERELVVDWPEMDE
jgi:N-methylhydantoinase B